MKTNVIYKMKNGTTKLSPKGSKCIKKTKKKKKTDLKAEIGESLNGENG